MALRVWFNPACSKCRALKELLDGDGVEAEYRHYLEEPPQLEELQALADKLMASGVSAAELIAHMSRIKDPAAQGVDFDDRDACLRAIAAEPALLQRPILEEAKRALVARPPELALAFLQDGVA